MVYQPMLLLSNILSAAAAVGACCTTCDDGRCTRIACEYGTIPCGSRCRHPTQFRLSVNMYAIFNCVLHGCLGIAHLQIMALHASAQFQAPASDRSVAAAPTATDSAIRNAELCMWSAKAYVAVLHAAESNASPHKLVSVDVKSHTRSVPFMHSTFATIIIIITSNTFSL